METLVGVIAVIVGGLISGVWLGVKYIKDQSKSAAQDAATLVSAEVDTLRTNLQSAQQTIDNLNEVYDEAKEEIKQIKKWYEASITDRKNLERDKETLGRQLTDALSKYHERDKDASVLEQKLENLYSRVEILEKESSHWRDKAEAAQSERDKASGGQEFVKNFLFELIERVEAKELVRRVVEDVILNPSHNDDDKKEDTKSVSDEKPEVNGG